MNNIPPQQRFCIFVASMKFQCPSIPLEPQTYSFYKKFNQILYHYYKNHMQQLVYVPQSGVISLKLLIPTDASNELTFYHAHGTTEASVAWRGHRQKLQPSPGIFIIIIKEYNMVAAKIIKFQLVQQLPWERFAGGVALCKPNDFAYTTIDNNAPS